MLKTARNNQAIVGKRPGDCHDNCGCKVAKCCLECSLPICKYDDIANFQAREAQLRWGRQIAQAKTLKRQGHHPRLIARLMGTTERTVYKYLAILEERKEQMS